MKLKNILIAISIPLLLTGCSGGDDTTVAEEEVSQGVYTGDDFTIQVSPDWETVDKDSLSSNIPPEFIIGFVSPIKNEIFTTNLTVNRTSILEGISSSDFGKASISSAKKNLASFKEISSSKIELGEEAISAYKAEFEGRQTTSMPIIRFDNLYIVKNGFAYTIIGTYSPTEDEGIVNAIGEMLDSFRFK